MTTTTAARPDRRVAGDAARLQPNEGVAPRDAGETAARAGDASAPLVSVVVVNYNGERYLRTLLPSLLAQTYPRMEIVVVDNASIDSSLELLAGFGKSVRVVRSPRNLGFAGGNNLGVASSRGRHVALINSDTVVDPDWLRQLVVEIESDPAIAAVGSKITFFKPYIRLTLRVPGFRPVDHGLSADTRELGLCLDEASGIEGCAYRKPLFGSGFGMRETGSGRAARWSGDHAELLLPFEPEGGDKTLVLIAAGGRPNAGRSFAAELDGRTVGTRVLTEDFAEHRFVLSGEEVARHGRYVINNAASFLDERGLAGDRGIYSLDEGQYDRLEDVSALCGCSMLLRRSAFDQVGGFDSSFFMYFEDVDLSWRLRRRGFRLRYQPASIVRHIHAGTSTEGSPLFVFYTGRNRLLMLIKNAPRSSIALAWQEELRHTMSLLRGCVQALRSGGARAAAFGSLRLRMRLVMSALLHSPAALAKRWGV
jgi:GT2 family glycosyltransferase